MIISVGVYSLARLEWSEQAEHAEKALSGQSQLLAVRSLQNTKKGHSWAANGICDAAILEVRLHATNPSVMDIRDDCKEDQGKLELAGSLG